MISIHRTNPEERGNSDRGSVIIAVMRDAGRLMRALKEWRNGRTFSGWLTSGGYNVGLRKEGMTMRWTVFGGLDAMAASSFF
jgi:hypothetical protein